MAKVKVEVAERLLCKFDGKRSDLYEFIDNAEQANSIVEENSKPVLFAIIQTKITGNARALLKTRSFADWAALKQYLLDAYTEKRSQGQWQLELSSCKQNPREGITSYASRVENCLLKLTNSLDDNLSVVERNACVKLLQNQALNVFITGLAKDIAIIVKSQKPDTLEDAVQYAIAEESEQLSKLEISKYQEINSKFTKHCSNCNRNGHATIECFRNQPANIPFHSRIKIEPNVRSYASHNNNNQARPFNQNDRNQVVCNYCKNVGHHISICRKRDYNNRMRNQNFHQSRASNFQNNYNSNQFTTSNIRERQNANQSTTSNFQNQQNKHLNSNRAPVNPAALRSVSLIKAEDSQTQE